jgi:hypothetical protein
MKSRDAAVITDIKVLETQATMYFTVKPRKNKRKEKEFCYVVDIVVAFAPPDFPRQQ